MSDIAKQGWLEDPAGRHQYRWFSQGTPTDLVKDGPVTSRDAISISDLAAYQTMELAEPPDDSPLLHKDDAPTPHFEIVNFGVGPVSVVNTAARTAPDPRYVWSRPAGAVERIAVFLPILAAILFFTFGLLELGAGLLILSFVIALLGWSRRRRRARRRLRP